MSGHAPEPTGGPDGLLLSRDLIFNAKVTGTARALGHRVVVVGEVLRAAELIRDAGARVVFVDLSAGDLAGPAALRAYRASAGAGTRLLAFGSHVDVDALDDARDAGCDLVLTRSQFSAQLPDLIRRLLGTGPTGGVAEVPGPSDLAP